MPQPPAEFVALQVSRLNEALLVAYSAMSGTNLKAVDQVVKIVRELDRYHGFSAADRRVLPDAPRLEHEDRLALDAPPTIARKWRRKSLEKAQIPPGNGAGADASDPQDAAPIRDEAPLPSSKRLRKSFSRSTRRRRVARKWRRKRLKRLKSGPEMAWAPDALDPQDAAPMRDEPLASGLETPAQELPRSTRRPPITRKRRRKSLKWLKSHPEMAGASAWGRPGRASFVSPAVASPGAFRRVECPRDAQRDGGVLITFSPRLALERGTESPWAIRSLMDLCCRSPAARPAWITRPGTA